MKNYWMMNFSHRFLREYVSVMFQKFLFLRLSPNVINCSPILLCNKIILLMTKQLSQFFFHTPGVNDLKYNIILPSRNLSWTFWNGHTRQQANVNLKLHKYSIKNITNTRGLSAYVNIYQSVSTFTALRAVLCCVWTHAIEVNMSRQGFVFFYVYFLTNILFNVDTFLLLQVPYYMK